MSAFDLVQRLVAQTRGTPFHDLAVELREALVDECVPRYVAPDKVRVAFTIAGNACGVGGVDLRVRRPNSNRYAQVHRARALAMYLLYEVGHLSTLRIAREMQLRDHTTVMYHRDKIGDLMLADAGFAERVRAVVAQFEATSDARPDRRSVA